PRLGEPLTEPTRRGSATTTTTRGTGWPARLHRPRDAAAGVGRPPQPRTPPRTPRTPLRGTAGPPRRRGFPRDAESPRHPSRLPAAARSAEFPSPGPAAPAGTIRPPVDHWPNCYWPPPCRQATERRRPRR